MVEGASLESLYVGNCIEGSNPFLSASSIKKPTVVGFFISQSQARALLEGLGLGNKKVAAIAAFFMLLVHRPHFGITFM